MRPQAITKEESDLCERLLRLKDELWRRNEDAKAAREAFRAALQPETSEVAKWANREIGLRFARTWWLPYWPGTDPAYLVEAPFQGGLWRYFAAGAVARIPGDDLPFACLRVDIRWSRESLRAPLDRAIEEAQDEWSSGGGEFATAMGRRADHLEKLLEIHAKGEPSLTAESLRDRLSFQCDISNISRWRKEIDELTHGIGYLRFHWTGDPREFYKAQGWPEPYERLPPPLARPAAQPPCWENLGDCRHGADLAERRRCLRTGI